MPWVQSVGGSKLSDEIVVMDVVCSKCGVVTSYKADFYKLKTDSMSGSIKHLSITSKTVIDEKTADYMWSRMRLDFKCRKCGMVTTIYVATSKGGGLCVSNTELKDTDKWFKVEKEV